MEAYGWGEVSPGAGGPGTSARDRRAPGWWRCSGRYAVGSSSWRCCRPPSGQGSRRTTGPAARHACCELTDALEAFTTEYPLVLVLEDLHWVIVPPAWLAYVARRPDRPACCCSAPIARWRPWYPLRTVLTELRQHQPVWSWHWSISPKRKSLPAQRFGARGSRQRWAVCCISVLVVIPLFLAP